jgi:hypothetical protein
METENRGKDLERTQIIIDDQRVWTHGAFS